MYIYVTALASVCTAGCILLNGKNPLFGRAAIMVEV